MEHTLSRKDYAVFESIYRINGAARRVLHWNEFVHAMGQVRLVLRTNKGSKRAFRATLYRSFTGMSIRNKLTALYGWNEATFRCR
ncbi:hypothetical protein OH77DRAFT_1526003 [Trametes cingulata]|nr:hypothetical protein OH77DRAFT_1526003 [Trametes cingulata]